MEENFLKVLMEFRFNWNIKGHDKVIKSLEHDIESGNVAHAYLFAGPAGIGKYSIAKKMAYILQCPEGFCGDCPVCREIEKGYHADTLELHDNDESLKINPIREIRDKLYLTKTANYKVLILENIERITHPSANALLKTLEDPPPGVIFLITSANVKDVLPTVVSRARLINLARLADNEVEEVIRDRFPLAETETVESTVLYAKGRPGKAVQMMENPALLEGAKKFFEDIGGLLDKGGISDRFLFSEAMASKIKNEDDDSAIYDFLDAVESEARKRMIDVGNSNMLSNADKYVKLLQKTLEARRLLKNNINKRMLLDNLMLTI